MLLGYSAAGENNEEVDVALVGMPFVNCREELNILAFKLPG